MVRKDDFARVDEYTWELSQDYDEDMQSPVRIFANDQVFSQAFGDRSIEQLINVSKLPGIVNYALAMPDMHQDTGFLSAAWPPSTMIGASFRRVG